MSALISSHEVHLALRTELLVAAQAEVPVLPPPSEIFANSAPGAVQMHSTRVHGLHVRLERWDGLPPPAGEHWEDRDELPWQEVVGGGPLKVGGDESGGLDVDGLGRARVIVLAARRGTKDQEEQWLLRFFPDRTRQDALAGPPRRLSRSPDLLAARDSWQQATAAVHSGGWGNLAIPAFTSFFAPFVMAGVPLTAEELLEMLRSQPGVGELNWDTVVCGPITDSTMVFGNDLGEILPALEAAAGMSEIRTQAAVRECLLRLEVVTLTEREGGNPVLAPNPDALGAWELLDLSSGWRQHLRMIGVRQECSGLTSDLLNVLRWTPAGHLTATTRRIADRLDFTTGQVRGALELLASHPAFIETAQDLEIIGDDAPLDCQVVEYREPTGVPAPKLIARMNHDDLVSLASETLMPGEAAAWLAHERPSARLVRADPGCAVAAVLGGLPQLPANIDWPVWGSEPLHFLAGIDLAAVHQVYAGAPLPADGWLLFFATYDSTGVGVDSVPYVSAQFPVSRPGWRVIFVPALAETAERPYPDHPAEQSFNPFNRVECTLAVDATLPDPSAYPRARRLGMDDKHLASFREAKWERFDRAAGWKHRVGGWADPTQAEPAAPVALAHAGLIGSTGRVDFHHADAETLTSAADDQWFLLLQLSSDDGPGWLWGDVGVMYFYVQPQASLTGDFTGVWMNWDCH